MRFRVSALVAATVVSLAVAASAAPLPVALEAGVTRGPVAAHGTTREAIATAPPAGFRTRVDAVPPRARLLTAIAVPAPATPGAAASALRFRIHFDADGTDTLLYERRLDPADARDRRWVDVGIGLDALVGRSGMLRFEALPATEGGPAPAVAWWAPPALEACDGTAPSVLLITIDALRADHLGSYGYARPTTPHLDAFAAGATRFASAFAGGPKTIPSVPQILTGHYFYWHRAERGLAPLLGDGTVASHAIVNNPWVASWLRNEQPGFAAVEAGDTLDARAITSGALRWLTAAGRCPTALYLHYLDTHTPYRAPKRFARRFIDRHAETSVGLTYDDVTRAWQQGYSEADRQRIVDLYDGTIAYTDRQLGRLFRGLARRGRLDRTLVIVTADHGEELWDHKQFFHGQSLFDELLHVPMLVRFPDVGHGRVVESVVSTVDVLPTVASVMGGAAPPGDGRSLRDLATGQTADAAAATRAVFALVSHAEPRTPERHAVRMRTAKLIHDVSDGTFAYYDLTTDPKEKRNLGLAAPGATELRARLDGFRAQLAEHGYQLRLRGVPDRTVRYVIDVATEPAVPVIAIDRLGLETGDVFDFKPRTSAFSVLGALTPGDEDRVRFDVLATTGVLKLVIRLDGAPAPEGTLRVGAGAVPAGAVVDLADPRLDGAPTPPAAAPGVTAELWRAAATTGNAAAPALDDATRQRLRQLGYVE